MSAEPSFFASAPAFGRWLDRHSQSASELIVGLHKVGSGRASMSWPESVDEALCRGWVDGVRKRIDEHSYQIRFTPRKTTSTWSAINIARVAALTDEGRMTAAGLAAFARRMEHKSRTYAYEQATTSALSPAQERLFRERTSAWAFFETQASSYRKRMLWRLVSATREATRASRLAALIEASGRGERL